MALALTRDRHAADDLAQDVFARALAAEERPVGDGLGPWLYRIARNLWIDRLRASGRHEHGLHVVRGARGDGASPSDPVLDARAEEPPVLALWRLLPEDERLVVWLRLMVDVPFREIAILLDTSKSAVDRTFRRALANLRKELER
jgi:RNA polymerase sigma-70 factor (ECF subfamily)